MDVLTIFWASPVAVITFIFFILYLIGVVVYFIRHLEKKMPPRVILPVPPAPVIPLQQSQPVQLQQPVQADIQPIGPEVEKKKRRARRKTAVLAFSGLIIGATVSTGVFLTVQRMQTGSKAQTAQTVCIAPLSKEAYDENYICVNGIPKLIPGKTAITQVPPFGVRVCMTPNGECPVIKPCGQYQGAVQNCQVSSAQCQASCDDAKGKKCGEGLVCSKGTCINQSCPASTDCICKQCNIACSGDECGWGLTCVEGTCKNTLCIEEDSCVCTDGLLTKNNTAKRASDAGTLTLNSTSSESSRIRITSASAQTPTPNITSDVSPQISGPMCRTLKIYARMADGTRGEDITSNTAALSELQPGDTIIIGVDAPDVSSIRLRTSETDWSVISSKDDSGLFVTEFTLPVGQTTFTFEADSVINPTP